MKKFRVTYPELKISWGIKGKTNTFTYQKVKGEKLIGDKTYHIGWDLTTLSPKDLEYFEQHQDKFENLNNLSEGTLQLESPVTLIQKYGPYPLKYFEIKN